jgi:thioesterase domain-containing protein/acyl carrier protein
LRRGSRSSPTSRFGRRRAAAYGPTETTTFATWHLIDEVDDDTTSIPIGLPIANTTTHVLDALGDLVPTGCIGELYIGGPGVAVGYLGDPSLTSERFVEVGIAPGRFYRTGDLVRRRRDGIIEYVGRADDQIKLRGHRVELGEIQGALLRHGVDAAAVSVVGDGAHRRIVAHVAAPQMGFDGERLRVDLRSELPSYMVPTEIVRLDQLPLTSQGKLDRQAIAAMETVSPATAPTSAMQPASAEELLLLELFRSILDQPDAQLDDDFFDLGGHSLLAIELLAGIEQALGFRAPISTIFDGRTPRQMARTIGDRKMAVAAAPERYLVTLREHDPSARPLWLVHPAGGSLVLYEPMVSHLRQPRRVLGVEAVGLDGATALATIHEMADHQVETITRVQPSGPYRIIGYSIGGVIAVEIARRLMARGEQIELLGAIEAGEPSGISVAPSRREKYVELVRRRDLRNIAGALGQSARRRLKVTADAVSVAHNPHERAHRAVLDAMVQAFVSYEPVALDVPVTLFLGDDNSDSVLDSLATRWGALATGGVNVMKVHGSHNDDMILRDPHAAALAAALEYTLEEIERSSR